MFKKILLGCILLSSLCFGVVFGDVKKEKLEKAGFIVEEHEVFSIATKDLVTIIASNYKFTDEDDLLGQFILNNTIISMFEGNFEKHEFGKNALLYIGKNKKGFEIKIYVSQRVMTLVPGLLDTSKYTKVVGEFREITEIGMKR